LDSYPQGFRIFVNNKERAIITPDSLKWLSSGIYNITLKKNFFSDTSFTINVVDGQRSNVFVDYSQSSKMLGSITCSSKPGNAEIIINDSSTGHTTPYTLQNVLPGNYYVKYHLANYREDSVFVSVYSSRNSSVYKFLVDTTNWKDYTTSNSTIPSANLTCVAVDKNNTVFIGTAGNGCYSLDGKNWKSYSSTLGSTQVNCCTVDNNNVLLYGTSSGFVAYDGNKRTQYGNKTSGLTNFQVQSIAIDKENNWFIGTQGGLNELYQPTGAANWLSYDKNYVVSAAVDINDVVWYGISNGGLAKKGTDNTVQYYNTSVSSLQSNNVTAVAAGPTGEVWVGYGLDNNFGHGLTCISGSTWSNYNVIPSYSKVAAIFIDSKNVKWVATNQGLVMFTSPSSYTLFSSDNTGLNINGVSGIAEDSYGNIWISTSTGLYEYKGSH
jgi:ligand-binding sensor domain-containing protein